MHMLILIGNEIDGDAFVLLTQESMKDMIKKQGLLLKFQHHFKQLFSSNSINRELDSDNPVEMSQDSTTKQPEKKKVGSTGMLSLNVIREQSKIFGRKKDSVLSRWQSAVNKEAFVLAQESPNRMYDRGQLKLDAEEEARKTYVFKKSHGSRSKFDEEDKPAKRAKVSSESRHKEIGMCSLELQTLTQQAQEIQKQLSSALALKDFEKCSALQKEYRRIQSERQKKETKLAEFQRKETRHLKYAAKMAHKEARATQRQLQNIHWETSKASLQ